MRKPALSTLLLLTLLASCAAPEPTIRYIKEPVPVVPPAELLVCQAAPAVPGEPLSYVEIAVFVRQLGAAHADCYGAVEAIKSWLDGALARLVDKKP